MAARKKPTVQQRIDEARHLGYEHGARDAKNTLNYVIQQQRADADLEMVRAATELMKQAGLAMSKAGYLALAVRKGNTNF